MNDVLVSLENVSRSYPDGHLYRTALANVSCQIVARANVAVTGRSGSGKSTLLHLMAGLDRPTSGVVRWPALGPEADLRPERIGVVFQTPSLLPTLNVLENVEVPWLLSEKPLADARPAALRALERLGLSALISKLPSELSGGQVQRVAVARALVCQPRLILADEPTGQLDGVTALRVMEVLSGAAAECGAALIVATHDRAVAGRLRTQWRMAYGTLDWRSEPGCDSF